MPSLVLYSERSGIDQFELVKQLSPARFEVVKRSAVRYMTKKHAPFGEIDFFEQSPWEFWNAKNEYGDSFDVLYMTVSMDTFVEIENEVGIWRDRIVHACPAIARAMDRVEKPVRIIAVGFDLDSAVANVPSPSVVTTASVVEDALAQAETLIGRHGAGSGLDRVHTAFHTYLESLCQSLGPGIRDDIPITALFAYLKQHHPALAITESQDKAKLETIFRNLSKIIDTLDHFRDKKSLAHPNPLLEDPEAMLVINVVRTMLRYLDMRLR
jgi:Abortive infection C-terminus